MNKFIKLILCCIFILNTTEIVAQKQQGDTLLVKQARDLAKSKNYTEALDLFLKADKTFSPDTTTFYGNLQHNIGYMYYMKKDNKNAAIYFERALKVFPQFSDKNGYLIDILSTIYMDLNDQNNLMRIMELVDLHNKHELSKPCITLKDYLDRGQYLSSTGDNSKAKEYYLQAIEKVKKGSNEDKENVYSAYARFLVENGDRTGAINYYTLTAQSHKSVKGEDKEWALILYLTALNQQIQREWEEAYNNYNLAYNVFERENDKKNMHTTLYGMGTCKYFQANYTKAREYFNKDLSILSYNPKSGDYAKSLEFLAKADVKLKNYDAAIANFQKSLDIFKALNDSKNIQSVLTELNNAYMKSGKNYNDVIGNEAENAAKNISLRILHEEEQNLPLYKLQFGDDGIKYARSLGLVAELTYSLKNKKNGIDLYEEYLNTERKALRHSFILQNEQERQSTWADGASIRDSLVSHTSDIDAMQQQLDGKINALAYDIQLLSKGILLNSSVEFSKVLEDSGNKKLKSDYQKVVELDKEINNLQVLNQLGENSVKISELSQERDLLTLNIMKQCRELNDFTKYIDYTWKDVQASLGEKDVAIEFAEMKTGVIPSTNIIIALIVAKPLTYPLAIPICLRCQASKMMTDSLLYVREEYGAQIWGNIFHYIEGCQRIYFSPDAEFANIGIEYLTYKGKPVIDICDMYRLSSTKELCFQHEAMSMKHVALFGGIDYGTVGKDKSITWEHTDSRSGNTVQEQSGTINFSPLSGTEKEVTNIQNLFKGVKGCEAHVFCGTNSSEIALRKLSGNNSLDILHIATHGQYIGNDKVTDAEAMQCSILALSGANLANDDIINDGIITAQDIADLNLRHCKLAVLSACETGLGKLANDGVFGLQRGFKNAGVHTLLMSLDKVNDAATTNLMTQFYKALISNPSISPNEALRQAQQYLRTNGYNNPKYWASFIILDGQ